MKQLPSRGPPLAYKNDDFLKGPDARPLRILSEYLEPLSHFRRQRIRDTIVFFGSARIREEGPLAEYYHDARTLAAMLTDMGEDVPRTHLPVCRFAPAAGRESWKPPIAARRMRKAKPSG